MLDFIISKVAAFPILVSLIVPLLFGEVGVVAIAFLAGQGILDVWMVVVFGTFGMTVTDFYWYVLIHSKWARKLTEKIQIKEYYLKLEKMIEKFSHKRDILILLVCKILVGSRVLIIIYMKMSKVKMGKFLENISIANFIWVLISGAVGWLAGRGFSSLIKTYDRVTMIIFLILVFAVISHFVKNYFKKLVLKKNEI